MKETTLKPCPFCGCSDVKAAVKDGIIVAYCGNRGCLANVFVEVNGPELVHTPAIDIIAEKWNRREGR